MKKSTKLLVLVAVLALGLFALVGCGGNDGFVGKWTADKVVVFGEEMSAADADMEYDLTVNSDGTWEMSDGTSGTWEEDTDTHMELDMEGIICDCTLEDGELVMDIWGMEQIYFKAK